MCALIFVGAHNLRATERAGAASCASAASNHVAVVIDYGPALGPNSGLLSSCVTTATRATGLDALRAAAGSIGTDSSGKICQIGPVPASYDRVNCSAPHDGTISYWAYFHGLASGWSYSSVGAGGWRARPDEVEGWHYVTVSVGQMNSAPPPRNFANAASYAWQSTCAPAAVVTTNANPTTVPRPPGKQSGSTAGSRPSQAPATTVIGHAGASPTSGATPDSTTTTSRPRSATTTSHSSSRLSTAPPATGLRSSQTARQLTPKQVAAAAKAAPSRSRPIGAIVAGVGGVSVVAIGLLVVTRRSRRRRM